MYLDHGIKWKSEIQTIYTHFQATLDVANFDQLKVVNE